MTALCEDLLCRI